MHSLSGMDRAGDGTGSVVTWLGPLGPINLALVSHVAGPSSLRISGIRVALVKARLMALVFALNSEA